MNTELLKQTTFEYSGLIWATDSRPEHETSSFETIDYLFSGLLRETLPRFDEKKGPLFLKTEQFGVDFFLIHTLTTKEGIAQTEKNLLSMTKPKVGEHPKLLLVNDSSHLSFEFSTKFLERFLIQSFSESTH